MCSFVGLFVLCVSARSLFSFDRRFFVLFLSCSSVCLCVYACDVSLSLSLSLLAHNLQTIHSKRFFLLRHYLIMLACACRRVWSFVVVCWCCYCRVFIV